MVHAFTASGSICALLAALATLDKAWTAAFAWLGLALLIDGIDGTFARLARVERHLPRFSGERLDMIVDYTTYVFVPVLVAIHRVSLPPAKTKRTAALCVNCRRSSARARASARECASAGSPERPGRYRRAWPARG